MPNLTIDDATTDTSIDGSEFIPISDGGSPKKISTGDLRTFILNALLNSQDTGTASGSKVFIRDGSGCLRRLAIDDVLAAATTALFGNGAASSLSNEAVMPVKDGVNAKTVTFAKLAELLSASMSITATVKFADLNSAAALVDTNLVLLDQSGNVKATLGTLKAFVLAGLATFIGNLAGGSPANNSQLLILNGTTLYTASLATILTSAGDVKGPASTTENKIPQWDSTTKKLKDGLAVTSSIANAETASASKIPTEAAVRNAIDGMEGVKLGEDVEPENGAIAVFDASGTLENGPTVSGSVPSSAESASEDAVPTEKAVATAISTATSGLAAKTEVPGLVNTALEGKNLVTAPNAPAVGGGIPAWAMSGRVLSGGFSVDTSIGELASNSNIPTSKAVHDAIDEMVDSGSLGATVDTVCIPGAAFAPSSVTPAEASGFVDVNGCVFDAIVFAGDAATAADAEFALPSDWNGGNLRVKIAWSPAEAGTAGDLVRFLVAATFLAEGSAVANPSALAPTPVTDALRSDDVDTTHITDAFTVTPPSGATGGVPVHLHLARDVSFQPSSGTMSSVPVGVLSVLVQYKRTNDRGMW